MEISIIVPIYNVEHYLPTCLNSIKKQTFTDFEIILVNDGSTDASLSIAKEFVKTDKRAFLVSQSNAGLSAARNAGLFAAKGKYIIFIDSDDWIEPNMLEVLHNEVIKHSPDFICFRLQFDNLLLKKRTIYGKKFKFEQLYGSTILKDALLVKNIPTAAWAKMYNHSFLAENNLKFEPGIVNEDTLFTIQTACCAQKVTFVNQIFYHAIEREGSISRSSQERLFLDMITALNKTKEYLLEKAMFNEIKIYYEARYLKSLLYNILQIAQRLDWNNYLRIYKLCINKSLYKHYNTHNVRKILSKKHQIILILSKSPYVCFFTVKILNCFSFRMH